MVVTENLVVRTLWRGRETERGTKQFQKDMERTKRSAAGLNAVMAKAGPLIAAYFGMQSARRLAQLADEWTNIENRIKLFTNSAAEAAVMQDKLFDIAQRTRAEMGAVAELFQRMSLASGSLGISQDRMLRVLETINKTLVISGTSAEAAKNGLIQLGQGFASGTLRGDELRSVLEQMPRLTQAIAAGMDVPIGKLRELGAEGAISAQAVIEALEGQAEAIDAEFAGMDMTVGQAATAMGNALGQAFAGLDDAVGFTELLVTAMEALTAAVEAIPESKLARLMGWLDESTRPAFDFKNQLMGGLTESGALDQAIQDIFGPQAERGLTYRTERDRLRKSQSQPGFIDWGSAGYVMFEEFKSGTGEGGRGPSSTIADRMASQYWQKLEEHSKSDAPLIAGEMGKLFVQAWVQYFKQAKGELSNTLYDVVTGLKWKDGGQGLGAVTQKFDAQKFGLTPKAEGGNIQVLQQWADENDRLMRIYGEGAGVASRLVPEMRGFFDALVSLAQGDVVGAVFNSIHGLLDVFGVARDSTDRLRASIQALIEAQSDAWLGAEDISATLRERLDPAGFASLQEEALAPLTALMDILRTRQPGASFYELAEDVSGFLLQIDNAFGGGTLPFVRAVDQFPLLRQALDDSGISIRDWQDMLTDVFGGGGTFDDVVKAFFGLDEVAGKLSNTLDPLIRQISAEADIEEMRIRRQFQAQFSQAGQDPWLQRQAYLAAQAAIQAAAAKEQADLAAARGGGVGAAKVVGVVGAGSTSTGDFSGGTSVDAGWPDALALATGTAYEFGASHWQDIVDMRALIPGNPYVSIRASWADALQLSRARPRDFGVTSYEDLIVWSSELAKLPPIVVSDMIDIDLTAGPVAVAMSDLVTLPSVFTFLFDAGDLAGEISTTIASIPPGIVTSMESEDPAAIPMDALVALPDTIALHNAATSLALQLGVEIATIPTSILVSLVDMNPASVAISDLVTLPNPLRFLTLAGDLTGEFRATLSQIPTNLLPSNIANWAPAALASGDLVAFPSLGTFRDHFWDTFGGDARANLAADVAAMVDGIAPVAIPPEALFALPSTFDILWLVGDSAGDIRTAIHDAMEGVVLGEHGFGIDPVNIPVETLITIDGSTFQEAVAASVSRALIDRGIVPVGTGLAVY